MPQLVWMVERIFATKVIVYQIHAALGERKRWRKFVRLQLLPAGIVLRLTARFRRTGKYFEYTPPLLPLVLEIVIIATGDINV